MFVCIKVKFIKLCSKVQFFFSIKGIYYENVSPYAIHSIGPRTCNAHSSSSSSQQNHLYNVINKVNVLYIRASGRRRRVMYIYVVCVCTQSTNILYVKSLTCLCEQANVQQTHTTPVHFARVYKYEGAGRIQGEGWGRGASGI